MFIAVWYDKIFGYILIAKEQICLKSEVNWRIALEFYFFLQIDERKKERKLKHKIKAVVMRGGYTPLTVTGTRLQIKWCGLPYTTWPANREALSQGWARACVFAVTEERPLHFTLL